MSRLANSPSPNSPAPLTEADIGAQLKTPELEVKPEQNIMEKFPGEEVVVNASKVVRKGKGVGK